MVENLKDVLLRYANLNAERKKAVVCSSCSQTWSSFVVEPVLFVYIALLVHR